MELKKIGSLMAFVISHLCVDAAEVNIQRIEIEQQPSTHIIGCNGIGSNGLILTSKNSDNQKDTKRGHERLTFTKYDTLLNLTKTTDAEFTREKFVATEPPRRYYKDFSSENSIGKIYLKRHTGEYEILYVDGVTMETKVLTGEIGKRTKLLSCRTLGDHIYMAGRQSGIPYVYSVNIKTGEGKMNKLSLPSKNKNYILSLETDDSNNEVNLVIKEKNKEGYTLNLFVFADGALTNQFALDSDVNDKCPESAFVSKMDNGGYIVCGTYSAQNKRKYVTSSIGVYFKKVENGATTCSSYINYLDMKNFNSYMSERQQERIEKKKEKKAKEGDEYAIRRDMLPYKVIEENGKYTLVGESYYPTYSSRAHTVCVSDGKGGSTYQTTYTTEFDGYTYTHYFVVELDQQGNMLWSNAEPLKVNNSFTLSRHLSINKTDNSVDILYPSFGHLNRDSYSNNGELQKKENISYVADDITVKKCDNLHTESCGDGTFLSSGSFKIKDDDGKRYIYSINRIKCD